MYRLTVKSMENESALVKQDTKNEIMLLLSALRQGTCLEDGNKIILEYVQDSTDVFQYGDIEHI